MRCNSFSDLAKAFDTIKKELFLTHRGCLLNKVPDGYILSGRHYNSLEEVDTELDRTFKLMGQNINRIKTNP